MQTWNRSYYQYKKFNISHFSAIDTLLNKNKDEIIKFRTKSILDFNEAETGSIKNIFTKFELVLGPVGASKTLHLLAGEFFPIWDREIARSYGFYLKTRGHNANYYINFMGIVKKQVIKIGGRNNIGRNPLKAIDEYNYCRFTKGWIN